MHIISSAVSLNVGDTAVSSDFFTAHPDVHESAAATGFVALTRPDGTDMVPVARGSRMPPGGIREHDEVKRAMSDALAASVTGGEPRTRLLDDTPARP